MLTLEHLIEELKGTRIFLTWNNIQKRNVLIASSDANASPWFQIEEQVEENPSENQAEDEYYDDDYDRVVPIALADLDEYEIGVGTILCQRHWPHAEAVRAFWQIA